MRSAIKWRQQDDTLLLFYAGFERRLVGTITAKETGMIASYFIICVFVVVAVLAIAWIFYPRKMDQPLDPERHAKNKLHAASNSKPAES